MQNQAVDFIVESEKLDERKLGSITRESHITFFLVFAFSPLILSLFSWIYSSLSRGRIEGVSISLVTSVIVVAVGLIPSLTTASISLKIRKKQKLLNKLNRVTWSLKTIFFGGLISSGYGVVLVFLATILGFVGMLSAMASPLKIILSGIIYCGLTGAICSLIACLIISFGRKY